MVTPCAMKYCTDASIKASSRKKKYFDDERLKPIALDEYSSTFDEVARKKVAEHD